MGPLPPTRGGVPATASDGLASLLGGERTWEAERRAAGEGALGRPDNYLSGGCRPRVQALTAMTAQNTPAAATAHLISPRRA